MANGYWNAHGDLDWLDQNGVENHPAHQRHHHRQSNGRTDMECKLFNIEIDSCNACGQDECLPAREFNREVEIARARAEAVAQWSDGEALTRYYVSFAKVLDVLFGGDKP